MPSPKHLLLAGFGSVAAPIVITFLAAVLIRTIGNCGCDDGGVCSGCELLSTAVEFGTLTSIVALAVVLPLCLLGAGLLSAVSWFRRMPPSKENVASDRTGSDSGAQSGTHSAADGGKIEA